MTTLDQLKQWIEKEIERLASMNKMNSYNLHSQGLYSEILDKIEEFESNKK